jgi:hypothetical protein
MVWDDRGVMAKTAGTRRMIAPRVISMVLVEWLGTCKYLLAINSSFNPVWLPENYFEYYHIFLEI